MYARIILVGIAMFTVLAISSCAGGSTAPNPVDQTDLTRTYQFDPDGYYEVPIIAGQWYTAGTVTITNDSDTIFFDVEMDGDWFLNEVHIQVVDDPVDFPKNPQGRLVPGHFDFAMELDPAVQSYTFEYPYDIVPGEPYYFAFHCVVTSATYGQQTGWGGTCVGEWKKGFYCDDTHDFCIEYFALPGCTSDYHATYQYPGTLGSYWNVVLSDFPVGYNIANGTWPGWCVQKNTYAYPNYPYLVCAYSVFAAENTLPPLLQAIHWDRIVYIVNNYSVGGSITVMDIQQAIWYYTLNFPNYTPPYDADTAAMIADANANGDDFVPEDGDLMAVVFYAGANVQAIFALVPFDCPW